MEGEVRGLDKVELQARGAVCKYNAALISHHADSFRAATG